MTPAQEQFWQVTLDSESAEYRRYCWRDTDCVATRGYCAGVNVNGVIIPLSATNGVGILETVDGISEVFFQRVIVCLTPPCMVVGAPSPITEKIYGEIPHSQVGHGELAGYYTIRQY